jgi:hypothetical protein
LFVLGVTASTGQLADNHDVLSLQTYSDFAYMEAAEKERSEKKLFITQPDMEPKDRLFRWVSYYHSSNGFNVVAYSCIS